jgi:hypothetical protein
MEKPVAKDCEFAEFDEIVSSETIAVPSKEHKFVKKDEKDEHIEEDKVQGKILSQQLSTESSELAGLQDYRATVDETRKTAVLN